MGGYHSFYAGADYGLNPDYGKDFEQSLDYIPSGELSLATDARTANQIKAASDKIKAGAKAVEIQMTSPDVAKAIPQEHLEELNRLRKLAGVELTLHGPLIEPTGVTENGWDETQRIHAEREMLHSIERGHALDPKGNLVVTFHTSAGLMEPEVREKIGGKEVVTNIAVVDERTGRMGMLPKEKEEYLERKGEILKPEERLDALNKSEWEGRLNDVTLTANRGSQEVEGAMMAKKPLSKEEEKELSDMYSLSVKNPDKYDKTLQELRQKNPELAELAEKFTPGMSYGSIFIRNAYESFKDMYNQAYAAAEKAGDEKSREAIKKLDAFREEIAPKIKAYKEDTTKILELKDELRKGITILSSITPEKYQPLRKFAIDKASDTFSNVAFDAYKKFGETAPVIALENPPVGMGLSRGAEINELVEETQKKLAHRLKEEKGFSQSAAEKEAKKLIGVTWDVGHINMLRKYGYEDADLKKETEKIARHVKKVHLADNFGFEHSELPMGMGNVPMQKHMEVLKKAHGEQLKKIKKVIEAGDWYQHFQTTPFSVFGTPLYQMKAAPYWAKQPVGAGSYFAGYGMNPDIHHSMYGAGFSMLPAELGGQMSGRSRLSGSPIE